MLSEIVLDFWGFKYFLKCYLLYMFSFTAPDITTTDGMFDVNVYRNCLLFR